MDFEKNTPASVISLYIALSQAKKIETLPEMAPSSITILSLKMAHLFLSDDKSAVVDVSFDCKYKSL